MGNYNTLKTAIQDVIKTNGNNEITGALLQQSLLAIITSLGAGYQYAGVATPETQLDVTDQRKFWIAATPGNYTNGAVLAENDVAIISFSSGWEKYTLNIPTKTEFNKLRTLIGEPNTGNTSYEYSVTPGEKIVAISDTKFLVYAGASSSQMSFIGYRPDNSLNAFVYEVPAGINVIRFYYNEAFSMTFARNEIFYSLISAISNSEIDISYLLAKKVSASDFYGVNPPTNLLYLAVKVDGYLTDQLGNNIQPSQYYYTSDFIEVEPNSKYALSYARFSLQYDKNKIKINGTYTDHNNAQSAIITTNANAKYIRMSFLRTRENAAQISAGQVVPPYSKYLVNVPFIGIPFENVSDVSLKMGQISGAKQSLNLFDANNVVSGYLAAQGNLTPNDSYRTTDFIPVESASNYALGYVRFVCQYDDTKQTISGTYVDKNSAAQSTIETVATAKYIRVSVTTGNVYRAQINAGNSLATYDEFGYSLPGLIVPKSKFAGKKAVCFGDSITGSVAEMDLNNWCMYLKNATGMDVINQGYWSGRVAYAEDASAVVNAFAFYKLVDAIISGDWSDQDIIYQTPGWEQHAAQLDKLKQIDFSTVDFLTIALGTNDLASDTPFEIDDQPMSVESVNGAFRYSISKLLTNYPQLHIGIMTPIYRFTPSTGDDYIVNGRGIQSFVEDYKELGKELHVPVCDMFNDIGVNKYNRSYYWGANGGDGLHPISTMKQVMGNKVAGFLLSVY